MAGRKLSEEVQLFIVQALACFDTPTEVSEAVNAEFEISVSKQAVEKYDPTKRAGARVSDKWRQIFDETRKDFLENTASIPIAHRAYRLRALQRMAARAEKMKNFALAAQLHEQAAKEVGDAYTNRRQLSGPNGKPLFPAPIAPGMTPQEAAEAYAATVEASES